MRLTQIIKSAVKGWFGGSGGQFGTVVWTNGKPRVVPSQREAFDQNTIVEACMASICREFASARLATATPGPDDKDVYDHGSEFAKRMRRPVPGEKVTQSRLLKAGIASYKLDGNAYFDLEFDAAGDLSEIWYVPHWSIEPVPDKGTGRLSGYWITLEGGRREWRRPDQILHVADGMDPSNPLKGRSSVKCLMLSVLSDNEADAYSAEIIMNPAIAGWAVLPQGDEDPGPENAEFIEQRLQAKLGRGGRGGVLVPGFRADIKPIGFSPEQLALDKLRRIPEERIAAVFNVPAIVAGLGAGLDRSTFANMEEARRYFVRNELAGLWTEFEDAFSAQLESCFDEGKGERAAFDTRNVAELQEPIKERWDRFRVAYRDGVIKRRHALDGMGLEFDQKADDVYYTDLAPGATAGDSNVLKARLADRRRAYDALPIHAED